MKFSDFLENTKQSLENSSIAYVVTACSSFEREVYRSLGNMPVGNYQKFYSLILVRLESEDTASFATLDKKSCDILLRNLDTAMEVLPESCSVVSRISTLLS